MRKENLNHLIGTLSKTNNWVSAVEIASQMHTTTRTVRSYVTAVNEMYAGDLILTSHAGYRWNPENSESLQVLSQLGDDVPQTKEERVWYIMKMLVYCEHNSQTLTLSIETLCDSLAVSDKTLEADLAIVRQRLLSFGLKLQITGDKLKLTGKESRKRQLIFSCIRHFITKENITSSYPSNELGDLPVGKIRETIEEEMKVAGLGCHSFFRECLLIHILVQILRIQNHNLISAEECQTPYIDQLPEYTVALQLAFRLQTVCELVFDQYETFWLVILLLCYCHGNGKLLDHWSETAEMTKECLGRLERMEGIDFSEDGFPEQIAEYFSHLKIRYQYGMPVYNPMATSLRNGSPLIQDEAAWIMAYFCQKWGIRSSRDELSFLTMMLMIYIKQKPIQNRQISCTLICPSCFQLGDYLKERLELHFGENLKINEISEEFKKEKKQKGHMVISTLQFSGGGHYVHITPALTSKDYASVRQEINRLETRQRCENFRLYLECYSSERLFERNHSFDSDISAIKALCEQLESAGYVEKEFQDIVLEREEADTTAYHNLVAIPHAVHSSVRHNSICILLNDKPINWGKKRKVNLIVLVAMERELKDDFRLFYETLIYLFENSKNMSKLLEVTDYSSFLDMIEKLVEQ